MTNRRPADRPFRCVPGGMANTPNLDPDRSHDARLGRPVLPQPPPAPDGHRDDHADRTARPDGRHERRGASHVAQHDDASLLPPSQPVRLLDPDGTAEPVRFSSPSRPRRSARTGTEASVSPASRSASPAVWKRSPVAVRSSVAEGTREAIRTTRGWHVRLLRSPQPPMSDDERPRSSRCHGPPDEGHSLT
jgi:hypothetical protein